MWCVNVNWASEEPNNVNTIIGPFDNDKDANTWIDNQQMETPKRYVYYVLEMSPTDKLISSRHNPFHR